MRQAGRTWRYLGVSLAVHGMAIGGAVVDFARLAALVARLLSPSPALLVKQPQPQPAPVVVTITPLPTRQKPTAAALPEPSKPRPATPPAPPVLTPALPRVRWSLPGLALASLAAAADSSAPASVVRHLEPERPSIADAATRNSDRPERIAAMQRRVQALVPLLGTRFDAAAARPPPPHASAATRMQVYLSRRGYVENSRVVTSSGAAGVDRAAEHALHLGEPYEYISGPIELDIRFAP